MNAPEIQQVLLNILNNAIQALSNVERTDKEINIETAHDQEVVTLSITDNGPGIPKDQQTQIFEFSSSEKRSGMGLGLWLCKQIVTRNNGSITYQDIPQGGAKFLIRLPLN